MCARRSVSSSEKGYGAIMQSQEEKLRLFTQAINSYAEKQRFRIIYETEQRGSAELELAEKEALSDAYSHIKSETAEVRASVMREISAKELASRRRLFEHRAALEEKVFADAAKRLADYTKTPDYIDYLSRAAKKAAPCFEKEPSATVLRARECDIEKMRVACDILGGVAVADPSIKLGGFIAVNEKLGTAVDMSFDSRLAEQRESFRERAAMKIG